MKEICHWVSLCLNTDEYISTHFYNTFRAAALAPTHLCMYNVIHLVAFYSNSFLDYYKYPPNNIRYAPLGNQTRTIVTVLR